MKTAPWMGFFNANKLTFVELIFLFFAFFFAKLSTNFFFTFLAKLFAQLQLTCKRDTNFKSTGFFYHCSPPNSLARSEIFRKIFQQKSPRERAQCNCSRPQIQLKIFLLWSGSGVNEKLFFSLFFDVKKNVHSKLPGFVIAGCYSYTNINGALVYLNNI